MSAVSLNGGNMEFDAAQALLDLQSNIRESTTSQSSIAPRFQPKEDMERAAKLFLSCIIASNPPTPASVPVTLIEKNNNKNNAAAFRFPASLKHEINKDPNFDAKKAEEQITSYYHEKKQGQVVLTNIAKTHNVRPIKTQRRLSSSPKTVKEKVCKKQKIMTRDVSTQTDDCYQIHKIESMEATIKCLSEKIRSLEAQIETANSQASSVHNTPDSNTSEDNDMEIEADDASSVELNPTTTDYDTTLDKSYNKESNVRRKSIAYGNKTSEDASSKVLRNHNVNMKSNDMVPIGDGHASVPSRLLRHINWNSYTSATRKLLTAVFSRRVLATHSLTGKPSPAFPNKPAKKKLDPALVNDIVQTVVEKCCVPENVVRTSITTKCADESKMYRTRQKNIKKRKHKVNRENIPPDTSDSEDF